VGARRLVKIFITLSSTRIGCNYWEGMKISF
jgi:hypothetical protein